MNNFQEILIRLCEKDYFHTMDFLSEEMSTVCRSSGYQFTVYPEPLGNPSFHVIYNREWEVVLQIKDFIVLEIKHGKFEKGRVLPAYIRKEIVKILSDTYGKITYWEHLLMTWNLNNPKYEIDLNTSIPK